MSGLKRSVFRLMLTAALVSFSPNVQAQTSTNQNICSRYKSTDAEMNKVYQQILSEYKQDSVFLQKMKTAQRAWLAFRDAHLDSLYPAENKLRAYGSVNSDCRCLALEELTAKRISELKKWTSGLPKGEVCAGSIKNKN